MTRLRAAVCGTQDELAAYVAALGGIARFTVVLTLVAVRIRRADDAESLVRRASRVATEVRILLVEPKLLWRVWHGTARTRELRMLSRNQRDETVSTVKVPSLLLDEVLRRFEFDGRWCSALASRASCSRPLAPCPIWRPLAVSA